MSDPTQEPAKPWLTERYIPQTCLGRKAGRQTWLAIDQVTGDSVVVKRLAFGRDFLWDDLKLFEREAQTLKSIDHLAIPTYLDFFDLESEGEQGFALVQSYIDARSLEEHVKSGRRFSEADLKEIAIQVLEILDYLHHCQPPVIHRDIKPSNILLAESDVGVGLVYLVDFGSVQSLAAREGSTITIVGTYGYMPPEQFGGRAYPTSDFYSLGATLIYLATGKHPADIPQGKDLRLSFEPLANLSLEMTGWIREMTHPVAEERIKSARSAIRFMNNLSDMPAQITKNTIPLNSNSCITSYKKSAKFIRIRILEKLIIFPWKDYPSSQIASNFMAFSLAILILKSVFKIPGNSYVYVVVLFVSLSLIAVERVVKNYSGKVEIEFTSDLITIDRGLRFLFSDRYLKIRKSSHGWMIYRELILFEESLVISTTDMQFRIDLPKDELEFLSSELGEFLGVSIRSPLD
jgi:serine/threonine protein kinase